MSNFTKKQKEIIKRLVELKKRNQIEPTPASPLMICFANIFEEFFSSGYIKIEGKSDVIIYGADLQKINSISEFLTEAVHLFENLKKSNLLIFHGEIASPTIGNVLEDSGNIPYRVPIQDGLAHEIFQYADKHIFISQDLIDLENNGFKTEEQIRHETEMGLIRDQLERVIDLLPAPPRRETPQPWAP